VKRARKLGLVALAALAIAALAGPSSAQASSFVSEFSGEGPEDSALYSGTATNNLVMEGGGFGWCSGPGQSLNATEVEGPTAALEMSPTNSTCWNSLYGTGTLKMNGCKFLFHPGSKPTFENTGFWGTFDIGPAGCGPITIQWSLCKATIQPKSDLLAVYRNEGEGTEATVKVEAFAQGLQSTMSGPAGCSSGTYSASYTANWEIAATDEGEEGSVGVSVEDLQNGLRLAGISDPRFDAEAFPASIVGDSAAASLTVGASTVACGTTGFAGDLATAGNTLALDAEYSNCLVAGKLPTTVEMNSCHYTLDVQSAAPYSGEMGIACSKPGDQVNFKVFSGATLICTVKLGAQSGLEGVGYENVGEGAEAGIAVDAEATGVAYEQSGICGAKSGSDAVLTASPTLQLSE